MSEEKTYVKGFNAFKKHEKAPSFVLGKLAIGLNEFFKFAQESKKYHRDYNGKPQLYVDILMGKDDKLKFTLDTWQPNQQPDPKAINKDFDETPKDDDLPF